nr:abc transporter b family member 10 [Quercus suber]
MGAKDSIFRYADRVDMFMLFGTLGSIGDGLQNPLMMFILLDVINEYGSGKALTNDVVNKHALKLLYAAIGVGFSAFIEGQCWTRTAERQTSRMRMEYLKSVLRQDVGFFDTQTASTSTTNQVVTLISSDANSIQVALCEKIPDCLAYMSTFVFCHISAFILSWRLTLAAIPLSIMFVVPGLVFGKIMIGLIMKMIESYGVAGGIAEQAISSIRTVYSYVGEKETLDRFSRALQTTLEFGIKQGLVKGMLLGSMGMIYIDSEDKKGKALSFVRGEIEFKDVYFCYPSRPDTPILEDFNLKVRAGKTVGLVGGSGSGQSTVIALLERFYDPIEGEILLDGYKIRRLQLKWLRSQLVLVNQEPVLFATTIKENILFGKEGATIDSVINAAKAANAHDFITKLPDGYETQVSLLFRLRNCFLSAMFGSSLRSKQRIAIARALLKDPKILLLDEATSALDAQSERIVQEAIDQASKGRTTIIIAHRLSTIRTANLIVVLQAGRVIESGSHNELISINDGEGEEYSKMVQLQQVAMQNEASTTPCSPIEGRSHHKMSIHQVQ